MSFCQWIPLRLALPVRITSFMRRTFRYDATQGCLVEVSHSAAMQVPAVIGDLPAYDSPIDGRIVEGRAARREDLKRNGCRPYEAGEAQEMMRRRASEDAALTASVDRTVEKFYYDQTSRNRELLEQAFRAGAGVEYMRK